MLEKLKKIEKIIRKIRYISEFVMFSIFIFFFIKMIYIKNYLGYFHKLYLLGTVIFFFIFLINLIYNFKKSDKKVEKVFLNIAIPIGLCFLLFMIPGHVPDENTHFYKAYDISCGNLITKIDENGDSFITVPKDLVNYNQVTLKNYKDIADLASNETNYEETEQVISTAQGNNFIMYVFSAMGFFIARILKISIFYGVLLGRLFNFVFYMLMIYLAIKKIPFGKLVLAVYALMPMCMQQASSFSPDAFINAISLYYIAFSIYLIFKEEKIKIKDFAIYILFTPIVCIVKMVYTLLAGIVFLIIKRKDIISKKKIAIIIITVIVGLVALLGTLTLSPKYTTTTEDTKKYNEKLNVDSSKQIENIINNPSNIIKAYIYDWYNMGNHYIYMAIGSELGWLELNPPEIIITLYLICLIFSTLVEKHDYGFNWKNKIWILLIVIGVMFLVEIALYVGFTPVGAEFIGGIQGRYYIPIYILLLLCLCGKEHYLKVKNAEVKLITTSGILNTLVIFEMIRYFL